MFLWFSERVLRKLIYAAIALIAEGLAELFLDSPKHLAVCWSWLPSALLRPCPLVSE
jgi:hypothetical protein